ncbi:hypothetical protein Q7C36_006577 [Tachysurus vachellii]|uniref:Uncharacterized protein n=1 Tax=Tachysurus vachellii TaxID=175792 RepID=A0AA88N9P7_TACVA|nr:hypothetical protein Q7C36_006577 [Tachysurus vachellii]
MCGKGGSFPAGREAVGTDGVPHRAERVLVFTCGPMGKKQPPSHSQATTARVLECSPPVFCTHQETERKTDDKVLRKMHAAATAVADR